MKHDKYCRGIYLEMRIASVYAEWNRLIEINPRREHVGRFLRRQEKIRTLKSRLENLSLQRREQSRP